MINYVIVLPQVLETVRQDLLGKGFKDTSPIQYLINIFDPDGTGMLYNKGNGKIQILSEKYILSCKLADEKNSIKGVSIKKCTTYDYAKHLSVCEVLPPTCTIITANDANFIGKGLNDSLIQDTIKESEKSQYSKKKYEEYKQYWHTQDIASNIEKEIIESKKIESVATFSSLQLIMDLSAIELSVEMENATNYQVGDNIVITSTKAWHTSFQLDYSHMEYIEKFELGEICSIDKNRQTITVKPRLKSIGEIIQYTQQLKEGYLWVYDIGANAKKDKEDRALKQLFNNQTANINLKEFIPDVRNAVPSSFEMMNLNRKDFTEAFTTLNENQRLSVLGAINTDDIFLIQGPPGTGKTTVICEAIQYLAKQGNKVLLSAQTHLAVDNVLQRIGDKEGIDAIRIGNEEKVELGNEKYVLEQRVTDLQDTIISTAERNKIKYFDIEKNYDNRNQKRFDYEYVYEKVNIFITLNQKIDSVTKKLTNLITEINETEKMSETLKGEKNYLNGMLIKNERELEQMKKFLIDEFSQEGLINLSKFQFKVVISKTDKEAIKEFKSCIIKLKNIKEAETQELERLKYEKEEIQQSREFYAQKTIFYKEEQHKTGVSYERQIATYQQLDHTYLLEYQEKESQISLFAVKSNQQSEKIHALAKKANNMKSIIIAVLDSNRTILETILNLEFTFKDFLDFYDQAQLFEWKHGKLPENTVDLMKQITFFDKRLVLNEQIEQSRNRWDELIKLKISTIDEQNQINQLILDHKNNNHVQCYLIDVKKDFSQFSSEDLIICSTFIATLNEDAKFIKFYDQAGDIQDEWASRMNIYQPSFEEAYVKTANLVSATCLGIVAKNNNYFFESEFDYLIIDEAGRASSMELLIPMVRGKKIILVGDHKQISPDIEKEVMNKLQKSEEVDKDDISKYKTSLFGLMYEKANTTNKIFLDTQYRMNNDISKIVSDFYYDGELLDASSIKDKAHGLENKLKHSFYWLNTPSNMDNYQESKQGTSPYNKGEIKGTIDLLQWLDDKLTEEKVVGVIAPYKAHANRLENEINKVAFNHLDIEVNTVDAFQGREKQIIIMNMVRNNSNHEVGFIAHDSRMNVAFSRAQELLFVIGNTDFIYENKRRLSNLYTIVGRLRENNAVKRIEEFSEGGNDE